MDEVKLLPCEVTVDFSGPRFFVLMGKDNRSSLLRINLDDGTVEGEVEDASEAAKVFVEYLRSMLTRPTTVVTDEVVERVAKIMLELRKTIHPLTQQGEDRIWRPAEKACALIDKTEEILLASMPTVVTGEQPLQSVGDHALPPSGLSQSSLSQAKPAAAITRGESK